MKAIFASVGVLATAIVFRFPAPHSRRPDAGRVAATLERQGPDRMDGRRGPGGRAAPAHAGAPQPAHGKSKTACSWEVRGPGAAAW